MHTATGKSLWQPSGGAGLLLEPYWGLASLFPRPKSKKESVVPLRTLVMLPQHHASPASSCAHLRWGRNIAVQSTDVGIKCPITSAVFMFRLVISVFLHSISCSLPSATNWRRQCFCCLVMCVLGQDIMSLTALWKKKKKLQKLVELSTNKEMHSDLWTHITKWFYKTRPFEKAL